MKRYLKSFAFLVLLVGSFSCDQDDDSLTKNNTVSFFVENISDPEGRTSTDNTPGAIFLSIEDDKGNAVYSDKKLALLEFGQGYVSESLEIAMGRYTVTKFFVLNASNKILYATPLEGSEKAQYVNDALPISFIVSKNTTTEVKPQVLAVSSYDTPENFGHTSFGFDVVEVPEMLNVRFKVELKVGDVIYQDVDTEILVIAYNESNQEQWRKEFAYTGPVPNDYLIKTGFHHYVIQVQKWGITDQQTITAPHLWKGRVDGPTPTTYVLGGAMASKKLTHYINYLEKPDPAQPGSKYMAPQYKIEYSYNTEGKLTKLESFTYDNGAQEFQAESYAEFTYVNERLNKISNFHSINQQLYLEHIYDYLGNGNVLKITEKNYGAGTTAEADFTYNYTDRLVTVVYSNSNGTSLQYEFFYNWKNISTDKTTRSGQVCSEGSYSYDKNINPLKHLGYVDFFLWNYSINNRLTENVEYKACAFPSLIPESYQYEYDSHGYPTVATTLYKSGSSTMKSQTNYFYQ